MRITTRFFVSTTAVVMFLVLSFSFWQAYSDYNRFINEFHKHSEVSLYSLEEILEPLMAQQASSNTIQQTLDKFSSYEKILGVSIHDQRGTLRYFSNKLPLRLASSPDFVKKLQDYSGSHTDGDAFIDINDQNVYAHMHFAGSGGHDPYVLSLFYESPFAHEKTKRLWLNSFMRTFVQAFFVSLALLFIVYLNLLAPIKRMAEWMKRIRLGENPKYPLEKSEKFLYPLIKEVSNMAKSLTVAREAAEQEARLRLSSEAVWTPERLKEFVRLKLQGRPIFVVSNREPYMHIHRGKEIEYLIPASGLVTAIEPVLKACGGTWIAQASGDADRDTVDAADKIRVPPDEPQYTLRRIWISQKEEEGFYYGFSNEGLWPLCHIAHTRPIFRDKDWRQYEVVNKKFAQGLLEELEGIAEPSVLIQDYHFALLPKLIKEKRPDARVAIFWHIPWPNPESFGICPWQRELLQGMLGSDIIGFHTQFHCNNFIETVDRFLESRIDYEHFTINREGHTTAIKPFPISIDFSNGMMPSSEFEQIPKNKVSLLRPYGFKADYLAVGVDRLDYTKGIIERFQSIEHFLENWPEYQGLFTLVELAAPSRSLIPKYQSFVEEVERESERINTRFKTKNWKPILFLKKHHSHKDILPFYKLADVCLVTSLHDGMNLVAKEFVRARSDEKGVLILSQFTGASKELTDALIINPYDIGQTSDSVKQALDMPLDEQKHRMRNMRSVLKDKNVFKWAADIVGELTQMRLAGPQKVNPVAVND